MKRWVVTRPYWAVLALCLALTGSGLAQTPPEERQVWAFYLSFWAGPLTWEWNETVLDDYPLLGLYNSKLPQVAAAHIRQAQMGGIDAFLVSWFGLDEQVTTTPALNNLLDRAAEQNFSIGVVVDIYPEQFNRDLVKLEASLRWLIENRARHPAYLHYQGRPVIAFAFQSAAGWPARVWQHLREAVDPQRRTLWLAEGLSGCCLYNGAMDGMYAFNMAWANGNPDHYIAERNIVRNRGGEIYIPAISPGWDEDKIARITGRRNPTSARGRAGGDFLRRAWQGALASESDIILVVTWNEFIENSHIEPSEQYGTQSLDILRELSGIWRGQPVSPSAGLPPACFSLSSHLPARVFAQASDRAVRIGRLTPGTPYALIDENNGLYAIDFGGVIGWVRHAVASLAPCENATP